MRFLSLLFIPLLITACNTSEPHYESKPINVERRVGEIGDFKLLSPENGFSTDSNFTFTWEEASNADYYQLEIANTETFINDPDEVYVKENNISATEFELDYPLPRKDITYFWRVTAVNKDHKKSCNENGNFTYRSKNVDEIPIKIEDEQDWVLHKEGSYADISIDRSNFFGNGKDSLAIVFDKEHTSQGIPKSDGWIVVTKTEDRELYGTDAFYFNFFYSGHDSTILIRVLDYDGEYWHQQVQIANNSKQTILMKYEDFTLRTSGTNIFNREFDWQHIRYFEIVFEKTFGDGVCLISDVKAVKYDNYSDMFMKKMDFNTRPQSEWTYENYDFIKTVSEDGNEIELHYDRNGTPPFNGYGFQNVNLYKYFVKGDALRMKIKITGSSANAVFYFRVLEEDMDRWQFKTPFTYLKTDLDAEGYKELIIPLKAFQRTDYMQGDGAKQFYFVQKFNIGLADNYATGSIFVKDLEVIEYKDILDDRTRLVGADGLIEDFNNYDIYTQIYYYWDQSVVNKDEAMKLDNIHKVGGGSNKYCAEFDYKADMEQAVYQLYLDTKDVSTDMKSFRIWLNDASVKPNDPMVAYIPDDDVCAEMTIQLTMDSGEWYRYVIPKVEKEWTQYTIAFEDFELFNEKSLFDKPNPLSVDHIIHMAFAFQYFYYDQSGKSHPTYAIANPVYIDEIYFATDTESGMKELGGTLRPDIEDETKITIDTFEEDIYPTDEELFENWSYATVLDYNLMEFSSDVSSQGGSRSLLMQYKGSSSVSYVRNTPFSKKCTAKGIALDIKGDGKAVVYLNLNLRSGSTVFKMRYAIVNIPTEWTHYEIGFDYFLDVNGTFKSISQGNMKDIENISFGIINNNNTQSQIYIDNMRMLRNCEYNTKTVTAIV